MSRSDLYARRYPLLPLKHVVIFPRNVVTLLIGKSRSIRAIEEAWGGDHRLVVTTHRGAESDEPQLDDFLPTGSLAEVLEAERQQNGNIQVVLEGVSRVRLYSFELGRPFFGVKVVELREPEPSRDEARALVTHVRELCEQHGEHPGRLSAETLASVNATDDPSRLADLLATQLVTEVTERQELLEELDPLKRLESLAVRLMGELDVLQLEQRIKDRVREQIDKNQREYYLRERLKAIHDELGGDAGSEIDQLREKIAAARLPPAVSERLLKEVTRLERMPSISAEASVARTYLDWGLALPWNQQSEDSLDLEVAEAVLDEDHYGLEHVKERIIEFLAVRKLTAERDGAAAVHPTILCLVGPPGVGKTSLGRSIAESMGRRFVRISLGGVHDEAEIRGHRRTYVGAFPGRIVQALKTTATRNPVILLDEIDKLTSDQRGDPASALLEVLDPEQNRHFVDHYLDLPCDLSEVLFICTANQAGPISRALRDRMELVEISGYTEDEKIEIARRYLLPKQLEAHGLLNGQIQIADPLLATIVRHYTREAGVRNLERQLATICRKLAREIVKGRKPGKLQVSAAQLEQFLGPPRYGFDQQLGGHQIGVAIGLGWTDTGGELIPVEVATMPGRGTLTITGQAGDVMQESARAALSYARSRAEILAIAPDFQDKIDLHIHLPEGATPKDGPSAGITMATALISALTKRPVRHDVAMTGEITLRGRVLPIGGLKEKVLAAHRAGIRRLVAPVENRRDAVLIPQNITKVMELFWVENMDEVIAQVLVWDGTGSDTLLPTVPLPAQVNPDALSY